MSSEDLARYGFVHIPKNGGTSIVRAIADGGLAIRACGHAYPRRFGNEEIVVLRDPFERFSSAFRYGRKAWHNPINDAFSSANDLAESAGDPDHRKHATALVELGNLPEHFLLRNGKPIPQHTVAGRIIERNWIYEPQSTWLLNAPIHLLRYHRLDEDFGELVERLGLGKAPPLPRLNQSEAGHEVYSPLARSFLESLYDSDFAFLQSRHLHV